VTRVLFCWELGANFGHLSNIALLQPALSAAGFDPVFAVADLKGARELLGSGARLFQAPVWPAYAHQGGQVAATSFADVLTLAGFSSRSHLEVVVDAWLTLFALIDPAIIITDHSPAAQIATRILGRPLVTVGTGFTMPPLDYPTFPPLRVDAATAVPEAELLAIATEVLASRGMTISHATLPQVFTADARIIIGLPELDPYLSFRREPLFTPVGGFAIPNAAEEKRLFAYLGTETPALTEKLQILCNLPIPVEIYIRGADPLLTEFVRLRGKIAFDRPADMRSALPRASHVLSQAGAMMASEALAAGRPHFLMPLHNESQRNATTIMRAGYGTEFRPSDSPEEFARQLSDFLDDRELATRTLNFAKLIAMRPLPDAGDALMRACLELTRAVAGQRDSSAGA